MAHAPAMVRKLRQATERGIRYFTGGGSSAIVSGLLEAVTQSVVDDSPVLLVAYDTEYPQPLHGVRPIPDTMGVALLLAPSSQGSGLAMLELEGEAGEGVGGRVDGAGAAEAFLTGGLCRAGGGDQVGGRVKRHDQQ